MLHGLLLIFGITDDVSDGIVLGTDDGTFYGNAEGSADGVELVVSVSVLDDNALGDGEELLMRLPLILSISFSV